MGNGKEYQIILYGNHEKMNRVQYDTENETEIMKKQKNKIIRYDNPAILYEIKTLFDQLSILFQLDHNLLKIIAYNKNHITNIGTNSISSNIDFQIVE